LEVVAPETAGGQFGQDNDRLRDQAAFEFPEKKVRAGKTDQRMTVGRRDIDDVFVVGELDHENGARRRPDLDDVVGLVIDVSYAAVRLPFMRLRHGKGRGRKCQAQRRAGDERADHGESSVDI
jgi:hypothetical protein